MEMDTQTIAPREISPFGVKVFFLNPSSEMEKRIISNLVESEYEVLVVHEYKYLKPILYDFPQSIAFINIDEEMKFENWVNYFRSFQTDPKLSSVLIGAFTNGIPKAHQDMFILDANPTAGFITLNTTEWNTAQAFKKVLDLNNAKGRRKYVRASVTNENNIFVLFQIEDRVVKLELNDISVVGFSCLIESSIGDLFKAGETYWDVTITIGREIISNPVSIYAVNKTENFIRLVCLFKGIITPDASSIIHRYIIECSENLIRQELSFITPDHGLYIDDPLKEKKDSDDAFLIEDVEEDL